MPVHFDAARWEAIRKTYDLWWNRKLDRPLMNIKLWDAYECDRSPPKTPALSMANVHDFSISPG